MLRFLFFCFLITSSATLNAAPLPETSIDPAGIGGTLLICGIDGVSEDVKKFFRKSSEESTQVVFILSETEKKISKELFPEDNESNTEFQTFLWKELLNEKALPEAVTNGKIFWLGKIDGKFTTVLKSETLRTFFQKKCLEETLIVTTGNASELAGAYLSRKNKPLQTGWALLPNSMINLEKDSPAETVKTTFADLRQHAGIVGYLIPPKCAMFVRQRLIAPLTSEEDEKLNEGEACVSCLLSASKRLPPRVIRLESSKSFADLTSLRSAARARAKSLFPPETPGQPIVEKGTLIIIGGGGTPKGLYQNIFDLAGGKDAKIVLLPTALGDPLPLRNGLAEQFRKMGAKKVTVLNQRRDRINDQEVLEALKEATGLWFGGGRQWRFVDAYLNTEAHKLMHDVLKRGGVIAGSSAGASIQAEYLARGNPLGNVEIMTEGYEQGLGFLPGVAIDQHFSQRKRQKQLESLVKTYPQYLGIGIDESTAIIVQGQIAKVIGKYSVSFYEIKDQKLHPIVLKTGEKYDLVTRKILEEQPKKKSTPQTKSGTP